MAHPHGSRVRTTNDEEHEWFFFAYGRFYTLISIPCRTGMATNPLANSFLRMVLLRSPALLQSNIHLRDDAQIFNVTPLSTNSAPSSFTCRPRRLAAACISPEHSLGLLTVLAGATAGSVVPVPTATTAHPHGVLRVLRPIPTSAPPFSFANNPFSRSYPASSSNAPTPPSRPASLSSTPPSHHPMSSRVCGIQIRRFGQVKEWIDDTPWQTPQPFPPLA